MEFTTPIRRALQATCRHDFLAVHQPRTGGTRPAWIRLQRVQALLATGRHNARTLAHELNTCPKTIRRDIACLATNGLPVTFDRARNAFILT